MGVDISGIVPRLAEPEGEGLADKLVELGVSWVRFEFFVTDPASLERYDRAIIRLRVRGLKIMPVLIDPFVTCRPDPREQDLAVFAQWVRQVYLKGCDEKGPGRVHRLGFDELTDRYPFITHWQLWNEPNVCGFMPTDPGLCGYGLWRKNGVGGERAGLRWGMQKFGTLLATVYAERRHKEVKLVTGGILNAYNCSEQYGSCDTSGPADCYALTPWEKYGCDAGVNLLVNAPPVQKFRRENGRWPFDILGLHPYQPAAWDRGYVPPSTYLTRDISRYVRRFVDASYPIWITEWSYDLASNTNQPPPCRYPVRATTPSGCEGNIAALLQDGLAGLNARPDLNVGAFFWFNFADVGPTLQTGLLDQNFRARPGWSIFQAAAQPLGMLSRQQAQFELLQRAVNRFWPDFLR